MSDVAARPITIEEYIESMRPYISMSVSRSVRPGTATFDLEDLMQDARESLLQVYRDYPEKFTAGLLDDLQKIGRRAIFYHTGNLYYSSRSVRRGGGSVAVPIDPDAEDYLDSRRSSGGHQARKDIFRSIRYYGGHDHGSALENLVVRESAECLAAGSDDVRRAFELAVDLDMRPAGSLPSVEAMKIFRRAKKKVQGELFRDGYMKTSAPDQQTKEGRMDHEASKIAAPESPDAPIVAKAKTAKPKAAERAALEKNGAARAKQNAAETAKASAAFTKGQKVTYVGGGRASWLKAGAQLEVKGTVVSRGRMYVRCVVVSSKKKISLSSALLKK